LGGHVCSQPAGPLCHAPSGRAIDASATARPVINTIAWAQGKYLRHLYYDLVKQATARMAYGMALELRPHNIAAIALAPGFVSTERVMAAHAAHPFDLSRTESPEYIGRAVAHLVADPEIMERTGQVLTTDKLAGIRLH